MNKIIVLSCVLLTGTLGRADSDTIARSNAWEIRLMEEPDGQSAVAWLVHDGKQIKCNEDTFALLSMCPNAIQRSLRKQLVSQQIEKEGGVENYRRKTADLARRFGAGIFDYLDPATKQEFAEQGVDLENAKDSPDQQEALKGIESPAEENPTEGTPTEETKKKTTNSKQRALEW